MRLFISRLNLYIYHKCNFFVDRLQISNCKICLLKCFNSSAFSEIVTKEYEIEGRYKWCGPPYQIIMLCRRYSIWIRNICLMYIYCVYNNLYWIFLPQMEWIKYRLQNMYNHMVGWAASVVSPFYFILLDCNTGLSEKYQPSATTLFCLIYQIFRLLQYLYFISLLH